MELQQLAYFVAVAETRSFTKAAERHFVTQPTLSRQIQQLEQDLGVRLFHRTSRKLVLSRAGRTLLPVAREALGQLALLKSTARQLQDGSHESLIVGLPPAYLAHYSEPLTKLSAGHPNLDLQVVEAVATELVDLVRSGEVDLVIALAEEAKDLNSEPLVPVALTAVVPHDHEFASDTELEIGKLHKRRVVTLRRGNPAAQLLLRACASSGSEPIVATEGSNSPEAVVNLVAAGLGIGVLTGEPFWNRPSLKLLPLVLDGRKVTGTGAFIWHPQRSLTTAARQFMEFARQATHPFIPGSEPLTGPIDQPQKQKAGKVHVPQAKQRAANS